MYKFLLKYFVLILISGCSVESQVSGLGEAAKINNSTDSLPPINSESENESNISPPSFANISLENTEQNNFISSWQIDAPKLISSTTKNGQKKLLEKLKKQYYNPSVTLAELPLDNKFKNIRELIPAEIVVEKAVQNGVSDEKKKSDIESKRKSQEIMENIEISGGFYYFAANNIIDNKIYFAYYYYYNSDYSKNLIPEQIPFAYYYEYSPTFFLRIKESNLLINSLSSDAPHLVYHIYDDGKTIGISGYAVNPIILFLKNKLTEEISTIELIFNPFIANDDSDSCMCAPPREPNSSDYTNTNNQVKGVSESDRVKTDGNYIYSLYKKDFKIYDIEKEQFIASTNIDFNSFSNYSSNSATLSPEPNNYYAYTYSTINFFNDNMVAFSQSNNKTIVSFINISNKNYPHVTKQLTFNGKLMSNSIIDNKIVMVFDNYLHHQSISIPYRFAFTAMQQELLIEINESIIDELALSDFIQKLSIIKTENESSETIEYEDIDNIYFREENDSYYFSNLVVLNSNGSLRSSARVLKDYFSDIYITTKSIFLYSTNWNKSQNTDIYHFDLQNFKLDFKGEVNIRGAPINRFCFHETKDHLFMAFHDIKENENGIHTISLGDEIKLTNTLRGMAPGENLKSVRFVKNKAYVVTFKVVDPLFIIDYKNPNSPKVLGEVKVTGYSNYLHEIYDGILLGVGFEANERGWNIGGKVSTFNVKSNNLFEIDKAITVDSNSNEIWFKATSNHLDFIWYPSRNLLALTYAGDKKGVLVYRLDSTGAIMDAANVFINSNYYESYNHEDKVIFIGDKLFYIDIEKITVYPLNSLDFSVENKIVLKKN